MQIEVLAILSNCSCWWDKFKTNVSQFSGVESTFNIGPAIQFKQYASLFSKLWIMQFEEHFKHYFELDHDCINQSSSYATTYIKQFE